MKIVSATLLLVALIAVPVVQGHANLRPPSASESEDLQLPQQPENHDGIHDGDPEQHRELVWGSISNAASNAYNSAYNTATDGLNNVMNTLLLSLVPMFLPDISGAFIDDIGNHMDPYSMDHTAVYQMDDIAYINNCQVGASAEVTVTNITGLSSLKLVKIEEEKVPTFTASAHKVHWDGGNWDVYGNITNITMDISVEVTSTDCGLSVHETVAGLVELTGIEVEINMDIAGKSRYSGTHIITDFEVKDIEFDIEEATAYGNTAVTTSFGPMDISDTLKQFLNDEMAGGLKAEFIKDLNLLRTGNFLPLHIYHIPFSI